MYYSSIDTLFLLFHSKSAVSNTHNSLIIQIHFARLPSCYVKQIPDAW
jgi:hypothetical protein